MASTSTATKKTPAKARAQRPIAPEKKRAVQTASSSADELSALALASKSLEDEQRALTGSSNSFISLVKANSGIVDKNSPMFVKGVKPLDFAIASKKLGLGKSLDATIVGMFKVYAEVQKKERDSEMAKTVKFWMPDDAMQFEVTGYFDRQLPNGNVLQPCHWVFVYLHSYPDIEDGLIAFRSKGNSIYTQLEKLIKAESSLMTELRFKITHQEIYNDTYKKTDYYPQFEITGRNYKLTDEGKVVKTKDSNVTGEVLKEILTRSHDLQERYQKMKLVGKQNIAGLIEAAERKALPGGKVVYKETDEEDQVINF